MRSGLPPELLDWIFALLRGDPASLRSCAAVSPTFSELVQRHLYRQITITNHDESSAINVLSPSQVSKLLEDTPRVVSHVLSLRIDMISATAAGQFKNDEYIGRIIPLFSKLTAITLRGSTYDRASWIKFDNVFRTSFSQILRLPSIESVTIEGIQHFPLHFLDNCPFLKRLALLQVEHAIPSISTPNLTSNRAPWVDILDLLPHSTGEFETILSWLTSTHFRPIRSFRVLHIKLQRTHISRLQYLLDAECAQSLECLHIDAGHTVRTTYDIDANSHIQVTDTYRGDVWDLSRLHHLQSLTIKAHITSVAKVNFKGIVDSYVLYSPLPWISELLQKPSPPLQRLTRVVLEIALFPRIHAYLLERVDWKPLGDTLKDLALHHSLRTVELRIVRGENGLPIGFDLQEIASNFEENRHLASLIESGILVIDTTDFDD